MIAAIGTHPGYIKVVQFLFYLLLELMKLMESWDVTSFAGHMINLILATATVSLFESVPVLVSGNVALKFKVAVM